jgi:hypothetical protein
LAKKAKKTAKKKSSPRKKTTKLSVLKKAPKTKIFVLVDGRELCDVKDLLSALQDMQDDTFWHHVNDARNDFANWIEDVFSEKELAADLRQVRDRMNTELAILRHLLEKLT